MSHERTASRAASGRVMGESVDSVSLAGLSYAGPANSVYNDPRRAPDARQSRTRPPRGRLAFASAVCLSRHQCDACRTRDSFATGPSQTRSDTLRHDHVRSCWRGALPGKGCGEGEQPCSQLLVVRPAREGVWRGRMTTLTAVGGGPCTGGGVEGGHDDARSCWWWELHERGCGGRPRKFLEPVRSPH